MARKGKHIDEEGGKGEGWLITYSDLVTLLLVFFVVLYAMANTDLKNFMKVALALRVAFDGIGEAPAAALVGDSKSTASTSDVAAAPLFFDNLPLYRRDFIRVSTELTTLARELEIEGDISINMKLEGIIISLSENLVFEPGSTILRPEAVTVLDRVAEILQGIDNQVRVEGHTDDIPTNSPLYPTNWELSAIRAVTIVRYLIEEKGIAPERFSAAGRAEYDPVVPNNSRANRALNRRADVVIVYPGDSRRFSITTPASQNEFSP
jgi:chemotaxis protein MotB